MGCGKRDMLSRMGLGLNKKGSGGKRVHEVKGKSAYAFGSTPDSGLRLGSLFCTYSAASNAPERAPCAWHKRLP